MTEKQGSHLGIPTGLHLQFHMKSHLSIGVKFQMKYR